MKTSLSAFSMAVLAAITIASTSLAQRPQIMGYKHDGMLTFSSAGEGNAFTLEFATDLTEGQWTNWSSVTEQPITGQVMSVPTPMFFRIRETPYPAPGMIRWSGTDFEGYNGTEWLSLTLPSAKPVAPVGMELIPAGFFRMGDHYGEGWANERPAHTVYVSAFFMDKFEATNLQMAQVLQWAYSNGLVNASATTVTNNEGVPQELVDLDSIFAQIGFAVGQFVVAAGKDSFPCCAVTWYGAQAYCNYRSDMEGLPRCIDFSDWSCDFGVRGYRLPTEAEWEKASRGGLAGHHYPWNSRGGSYSNHISGSRANYLASGDPFETAGPVNHDTTPTGYYDGSQVPAGTDMANGYGLYDMAGNVQEWCWDVYSSDWYPQSVASQNDTTGPTNAPGDRVLRGGSWDQETRYLRCSYRNAHSPHVRGRIIGFRCVRSP